MRSLLALFALAGCSTARSEPAPTGPIVLELFTSQGCSSCPSADRLLAKLTEADRRLVALSFHVDYWNDLGWRDPYSAPAWTSRQHAYAAALGDTRVYTPELVVGGAAGMVGSNATAITAAIAAAERPALLPAKATWSKATLEVSVSAPANAEVYVAIYEGARTNKVPRGENAGTTSVHHNVVRRLERVAARGKPGTLTLALDPGWTGVGAVVFAQRSDKKIVASAALPRM